MTFTNRFYRDEGWWYIDLPEWTGSKAELAMVQGADKLLDFMAGDKEEIYVTFADTQFDGSDILHKISDGGQEGGAYYFLYSCKGEDQYYSVWLCDVTKFIFGEMPRTIYFK